MSEPWLLLDPPSSSGYARRASLREKTDAPKAPFPSIDLILMSGHVREAGFAPVFIDAQIRRWNWERLHQELTPHPVRGVLSLVSSSELKHELADLKQIKVALGGVPVYTIGSIHTVLSPTAVQALLEEHPWLDGLVLNTAENNFSDLISGREVEPINVATRIRGHVTVPQLKVSYTEELRIPKPEHLVFKDARYFYPQSKRTPVTCMQLSFGCPYTCEFCLDNALYRKMCYRAVDDVIAELEDIERLGFREVYFKDLTFGLNKRVTTEFLHILTVRRLKLNWLCTTRVDVATEKLLTAMQGAGCYGIEFGVESGVRHRRAANGKPVDDDAIRTVFRNCRDLGIETTAFVMIGFEDETEEEVRQTIEFIESLRPDYVSYNVVNALPGTTLYQRAESEGFLRTSDGDLGYSRSNLKLRYLDPQRVETLRAQAMRSFYRRPATVFRRLARARSLFELRKLARLSRVAL